MNTRNYTRSTEAFIDLTGTNVTGYPRSNNLLSNSIICIDSDDSLCFSPCKKGEDSTILEVPCESLKEDRRNKKCLGECPICWDQLGKKPLSSTICGHVFCTTCIKNSLNIEKRCPICRTVLKGKIAYHPLYLGK